eukprot:6214469-Pleurochrysis_carterae.AAC.5
MCTAHFTAQCSQHTSQHNVHSTLHSTMFTAQRSQHTSQHNVHSTLHSILFTAHFAPAHARRPSAPRRNRSDAERSPPPATEGNGRNARHGHEASTAKGVLQNRVRKLRSKTTRTLAVQEQSGARSKATRGRSARHTHEHAAGAATRMG